MSEQKKPIEKPGVRLAVPEELQLPIDPLRVRLDFHHQVIEMTDYEGEFVGTRMVSGYDLAMTMAKEITINSGLLPENALWWRNTKRGQYIALYVPPKTRILALQKDATKPALRFNIPLPGLIFICSPRQQPWVYAVKKRPQAVTDKIYKAPFFNTYENGNTCAGTNQYPETPHEIAESFFQSFFTMHGNNDRRSIAHPGSLLKLWESLKNKKEYPMEDLVDHGTVRDLLVMEMG